jgi:pimeloyl-ACP methyl ester carboxylesterase
VVAASAGRDILVLGGGHLLPLTHPEIVNQFLREQMARFGGTEAVAD